MLKIGLTGNMGSGKSVVAGIFRVLGVPVYHADNESKKFLDDPEVIATIADRFGNSVQTPDHRIDRKGLASVVFTDSVALNWLNALLHPRVREDFRKWAAMQSGKPYIIQEAAIIFESGMSSEFDRIIHVSCPKETAVDRVVRRDGADSHSVLSRMRFQMDDGEKAKRSDYVILNDGSEPVIPQVLAIHKAILKVCTERNDDVAAR